MKNVCLKLFLKGYISEQSPNDGTILFAKAYPFLSNKLPTLCNLYCVITRSLFNRVLKSNSRIL